MTFRRFAPVVLGVMPALALVGCGDSGGEGAAATLVNIQGSSYVTLPPATTTTTTTTPEAENADGRPVSDTEQTYTVQGGDSVSAIADRYGLESETLANYNQWSDGIFHAIFPGDTVLIPPQSIIPSAAPAASQSASDADADAGAGEEAAESGDEESESSGDGCTYTIVANDNPSKVASQFGITVDQLVAANDASVMSTFLVGAELTIPPGGDC